MRKMTKDIAMNWIETLRSGKYKQGNMFLQREKGYCCLGVLCELAIRDNDKRLDLHGRLFGTNLRDQELVYDKLKGTNLSTKDGHGIDLALLNDDGIDDLDAFNFNEIADIIQAVLIEEVI